VSLTSKIEGEDCLPGLLRLSNLPQSRATSKPNEPKNPSKGQFRGHWVGYLLRLKETALSSLLLECHDDCKTRQSGGHAFHDDWDWCQVRSVGLGVGV
jgi:hypothetical protein